MSLSNEWDKFYTNDDAAALCWMDALRVLGTISTPIVEPSAGGGAFLRAVAGTGHETAEAYDAEPEAEGIERADFLEIERDYDSAVTIGNPPFGRRCRLAVEFFNRAASFSDAVCFIVPVTFAKWSVQSKLDSDFKLVFCRRLPENSFSVNRKPYSIRCLFQIWIRKGSGYDRGTEMPDERLSCAPPLSKDGDFRIWQHNATEQSRRYIDEPWEIAVWRQGYKDYSKRFRNPEDYDEVRDIVFNTNQQLFFVKPLTDHAKQVIERMDFDELAKTNMSVPGFGKRDFVQCYEETEKKMVDEQSLEGQAS